MQFGLAINRVLELILTAFISGTTSGTLSSYLNADELSIIFIFGYISNIILLYFLEND